MKIVNFCLIKIRFKKNWLQFLDNNLKKKIELSKISFEIKIIIIIIIINLIILNIFY